MGLEPVVAPLFTVRPLEWEPPQGPFDAILLTSANAARHGGPQLGQFASLPCYAVGEATAEAARAAGFQRVTSGPSDGAAAVEMMSETNVRRALHLCARDHIPLSHSRVEIKRRQVYASEAVETSFDPLPDVLVLLHSPRTATRFAQLVADRSAFRIAAISQAAAEAAGEGWREVHVAPRPRDEALLELATKLCQTAGDENGC